jgi:KUP system potassium uptake protein
MPRRGGQTPLEPVILGILSLIIWALILIVTVKYVLILLRADNDGEGGTLALMALANRAVGGKRFTIILLGIISAALFYGDALITPAISVLSAVEGLKIAPPALEDYVVPLTVLILFGLFAVQSHGTARVAASVRSRLSGSSPLLSAALPKSRRAWACLRRSTQPTA